MIKNLFGKKKEPKQAESKEKALATIQTLDKQISDIEAKIDFNEKKANGLQEEAKAKLKAGDKLGAKKCLAKKKRYNEQIKQYEGAATMMEEQKMMLENAEGMKSVFKAISVSNQVLKEANKGMNVEDVEKMREDMEDIKADQEEIKNFFETYNEEGQEDLDEELEGLEAEIAKEVALPSANIEEIVKPNAVSKDKNKEEEALADFLA